MKITFPAFGLTALRIALAAPAPQHNDTLTHQNALSDGIENKWATLRVNSISGNHRLFKNRALIDLPEATIPSTPQNHAPQPHLSLPRSFGTENFTIHPPTPPVRVFLQQTEPAANETAARYAMSNAIPTSEDYTDVEWVSQYAFPAPDDMTAMGWFSFSDEERQCPVDAGCDGSWAVDREDERWVLEPGGRVGGGWDAVRTDGGKGWRVVWKEDVATVEHAVRIDVVVEADGDGAGEVV